MNQHSLSPFMLLWGFPVHPSTKGVPTGNVWLCGAHWRGDAVPCILLSLFGIAMDLSVLPALRTASPACPSATGLARDGGKQGFIAGEVSFPFSPLISIHLPGEVEAAADIGAGSVSYVNARVCKSRPLTPGSVPASIPVSPPRGLESIPVPPARPAGMGLGGPARSLSPCWGQRTLPWWVWGHPDFPHSFHLEFPRAALVTALR